MCVDATTQKSVNGTIFIFYVFSSKQDNTKLQNGHKNARIQKSMLRIMIFFFNFCGIIVYGSTHIIFKKQAELNFIRVYKVES